MTAQPTPSELRAQIRSGQWNSDTSGACPGAVQANLVMLPKSHAFDFLLFCVRNPKPCPILDVLEPGQWEPDIARGADLRRDLPRYRVFRNGVLDEEPTDVAALFDHDTVFVGSANLDPRSLRINTEMGLLIESPTLNRQLREVLEPDFSPRNAWQLQPGEDGRMTWVSDDEVVDHQPTHSYMRRIEDWFLTLLPIENEM